MSQSTDQQRAGGSRSAGDAVALGRIFDLLRGASGVDFSQYKAEMIERRLARRLSFNGLPTLTDYVAFLLDDPNEVRQLYGEILVHVTSFFRDPEVFQAVATETLPTILNGKQANKPIRVWVAGCATGEEVYSLAILLLELLGDRLPQIQVFGTDVSHAVISHARRGRYPESALALVTEERRDRYFVHTSAGYQVKDSVRDLCTFFQHDLAREPPVSRVDLVSCRNVIMYFDRRAQRQLLARLHFALEQPGFLLLGSAEYVLGSDHLFSSVDDKKRIFSRKATPAVSLAGDGEKRPETPRPVPGAVAEVTRGPGLARYLDRMLLKRYVPPAVLVNDKMQVLEFRGNTAPYLELAPGDPSNDLLTLVRRGLRSPLLAAFGRAKNELQAVRMAALRIHGNGPTATCDLVVVALAAIPFQHAPLFLVMFEPSGSSVRT